MKIKITLCVLLLTSAIGFASQRTPRQFEYKMVHKYLKEDDLNKWGTDGWELVAVDTFDGKFTTYYLRREK